jgi:hypothetical protein
MSDGLSGVLVLCWVQVVWVTIKLDDLKKKVARLEEAIHREQPPDPATRH